MKSSVRQINLYRMMLRYCVAAIATALVMGTIMYFSDKVKIKNDPEYRFTHMRFSWEEDFGVCLSMILIPILMFAGLKHFFWKKNENLWLNAFLFVFIVFLFFLLISSATWGLSFGAEVGFMNLFMVFTPYALFPIILILSGKFIKPLNELPESIA